MNSNLTILAEVFGGLIFLALLNGGGEYAYRRGMFGILTIACYVLMAASMCTSYYFGVTGHVWWKTWGMFALAIIFLMAQINFFVAMANSQKEY